MTRQGSQGTESLDAKTGPGSPVVASLREKVQLERSRVAELEALLRERDLQLTQHKLAIEYM